MVGMLAHARQLQEQYLQTLRQLVEIETPSGDKPAGDRFVGVLTGLLEEQGWTVRLHRRDEVGDIIEATWGPAAGGGTLLLTHYDTVWPVGTLQHMPFRQEGDTVYGPGTDDMKAGIVSAIFALRLLKEQGREPSGRITLLVTSDEESGSLHSRELIEELGRAHERVLVLESGRDDGAIKVGRKGVGHYRVTFRGRSSHAGNEPKAGASALRELAHFLLYAEELGDDELQTSVNLTVASGGTVINVISEEARAEIDVRVLRASEFARVDEALRSYTPRDSRVKVEIEGGENRPPLERTPRNEKLWQEVQEHLRSLDLDLPGVVVGGGSDGNFTSALGIPTIDGLGPAGAGAHARNEHIRLQETLDRVALLASILAGQPNAGERLRPSLEEQQH